ncbi:PAS domain-containing protein [Hymenobacter negativus]|uniref:histidine kinase n=1 Tax=Hymenobacter negativus TaxID=2795026 RepID=A0ABS0QCJ6_9BACT|nr:PAS domain-containing protein [Hymenobacter negativus]MBH8560390.1 PAS domain-containing protein [Hymenobacter negativus]
MSAPASSVPAPFFEPDTLLHELMAVSLTGINLLRPCYGPTGELDDFAPEYFNPAAQRMTGLPEQPAGTARTLFPNIFANGIFDFYRQVFETGEPGRFELYYQADSLDNYFLVAARRSGELLLVSFTDMSDQPRTAAENALRAAQAAEQAARAEAEAQRRRFHEVLMQLPAHVAVYHGPDHIYQFVNPAYQRVFPHRSFAGRPFREAMPESEGLGVIALFDRVYQTGEPFYAQGLEGWFDFQGTGQPEQFFFDLSLHPLRDAQGRIDGILDFSYNVTEQVRARRQVEQLNQELEARVQERTHEAQTARAQAEWQRARLEQFFMQAPAAICVFDGPEFRYELVNPAYQALFAGRPRVGLTLLDALPELAGQRALRTMQEVYDTGQTHREAGVLVRLARPGDGQLEDRYFDYIQQARRDEHGRVDGVLVFAYEVTDQTLARQRTEALQAELLAAAQRQAQERETFYQVFEQTPALVCILRGPEHRYEYLNSAYQRQFPGRQLAGRPVAEALPETVEQGFIALLDGVYHTGQTYFGQELLLTIEATANAPAQSDYYNLTYQAYREQGQIVGVCVFAYVVTEQVRARRQNEALQAELLAAAQDQAREREELYQAFSQSAALILLLRGPEHRIEYVNEAYARLFPGRGLHGSPIAASLPEAEADGFTALLDGVYHTGQPYVGTEVPLTFRPDEGGPAHTIYFNFTYQAYQQHGHTQGVSVFAYDVTEQVRARQEREAQRQQLAAIFEQAPVAICLFSGPGFVLDLVNPPMGEMLGRPLDQLVGRPFFAAVPEVAEQGLPALLEAVRRTGTPFVAQEQEIRLARHRPGETGFFNFTYQPLRDAQGNVTDITCVAVEVTGQVLARRQVGATNQELAAANQQLSRTNVDLDNFIYTASHDLKAPITNIEGLLDTLHHELPEQPPTGEVAYILNLMQGAVERFKRTIDHLTEVSKLQKEHDPPTAHVALAPVLEDVRLDLAPLLRQTGGRLHLPTQACPPLRFSEKNLRSVVYNLLSNALKYRHPDRRPDVHVRCRQEAGYVVLEVQDNGLGLDLAREAQLFAMFQRLHTHVEGSGLGLYMVKRMLENAGGKITVQSQVGEGTTFAVYFPH